MPKCLFSFITFLHLQGSEILKNPSNVPKIQNFHKFLTFLLINLKCVEAIFLKRIFHINHTLLINKRNQ